MNCDEALTHLDARLDDELADDLRERVDIHLQQCSACREESSRRAQADDALRRAFADESAAASRIAACVLSRIPLATRTQGASSPPPARTVRTAVKYLASAAAGFLAAMALFQSDRHNPPVADAPTSAIPQGDSQTTSATAPPAAHLTDSTGPIEFRAPAGDWTVHSSLAVFNCPSDSGLRTPAGSLCEIESAAGAIVRMDASTEVTLRSPTDIAVHSGRIWCQAPPDVTMTIRAPDLLAPQDTPAFTCVARGATCTVQGQDGEWAIHPAAGDVQVQTPDGPLELAPGQRMILATMGAAPVTSAGPAEFGWMWPLLVRHGTDNPELQQYVDPLLARLGATKAAYFSQRDIRALGEYGALPLLRFVQSASSGSDASRRNQAMEILADVAPVTMIADLIELLADESPEIRVAASRALERLTGETQGHAPETWRQSMDANAPAIDAWRQWWATESGRYPRR